MKEVGFQRFYRTIHLTLIVVFLCLCTYGKTIYVDNDAGVDYKSIQDGINAAENGDTVSVAPGTYYENITLKNGINLFGAGAKVTIIDANGYGDVVDARANDATISGFTLRNSGQFDSGHTNCGVYLDGSYAPIIRNNVIVRNNNGIGIWYGANPYIRNNIIANNSKGLYIYGSEEEPSNPDIINNTIVNNGIDGITLRVTVSPVIVNNIITGHTYGINHNYVTGSPVLNHNNLWNNGVNYLRDNSADDTLAGPGSISVDPYFAEPGYWDTNGTPNDPNDDFWAEGDYHLKSRAGRWDPNSQRWVVDYITSTCIDVGDPNIPVGNEPMPNGGRINMGAYGGTSQASKSYILSKIIYVDDDAVGNNDGTSWENAYTFLQDALVDANSTNKPVEIRVAQGIYKPDQGSTQTLGDPRVSFRLINDVSIRGGYAGPDKPDPNDRDIRIYKTILSGDLSGNDVYVNDPCDLIDEITRFDNSWNVVDGSNIDATAVLDGFTITSGHIIIVALGGPAGGAGMLVYSGSPTLFDCTFTGNATSQIGGGMYNRENSHPTLVNCTFAGNYAESGGGMSNMPRYLSSEGSHPELVNCTFDNNYALKNGGGMYNSASNPTLINCTFRRNQVIGPCSMSTRGPNTGVGGGMYSSNSSLVLADCVFSENSAGGGGGICNGNDSSIALKNCTFIDNSASQAGAGLLNPENSTLTLTNCRFINNTVTGIGGGMWNGSTNATLVDCVFSGNSAHDGQIPYVSEIIPGSGGGMSDGGTPTLIRCTFRSNYATNGAGITINGGELAECIFTDNSAVEDGGAIHTADSSSEPTITNCTFSGNSANRGGGIFFTWGARMIMANCTFVSNSASIGKTLASEPTKHSLPGYINLINCILWDGDNAIFDPEPYALRSAITYSNVHGGWYGEGNIDADPCFADPGYWANADDPNIAAEPNDPNAVWVDGDYHLKSQAGRWDPVSESWVQDDVTSPCIDAGDPNSPIGPEPFPNGGRINMGAYGGTEQASLSLLTIQEVPGIPP